MSKKSVFYSSKLVDRVFSSCDTRGEKMMLHHIGKRTLSGIQYKQQTCAFAEQLSSQGVVGGMKVVILVKDPICFAQLVLASIMCGAVVVLLEPTMSKETITSKIDFLQPDVLLVEGVLYDLYRAHIVSLLSVKKYASIRTIPICLTVGYSFFSSKKLSVRITSESNFSRTLAPEETPTMIVFTGGTTGSPKGVVHTLRSAEEMFTNLQSILHIESTTKFYADLPHFLLLGIYCGGEVVIGSSSWSNKKFLNMLEKNDISLVFTPPYRWYEVSQGVLPPPSSLKHLLLGSAPVTATFLGRLLPYLADSVRVSCVYGMTEILPMAVIDGREKVEYAGSISGDVVGYLCDGVSVNLKEKEIVVSGRGLCYGYAGHEQMNEHYTGDLGEIKNGLLSLSGRKKDMIIRKDFNIYPSLYESALSDFPGIVDVALIGVRDERMQDEKVILGVESTEQISMHAYQKHVEHVVDKEAWPDQIIFCTLPKIGRQQKIDKQSLRDRFAGGVSTV